VKLLPVSGATKFEHLFCKIFQFAHCDLRLHSSERSQWSGLPNRFKNAGVFAGRNDLPPNLMSCASLGHAWQLDSPGREYGGGMFSNGFVARTDFYPQTYLPN
jgi:hypothetical protein